ncbi:hypothetical protein ACFVHB_12415 [Kitasatospora sp. NPDC127111]|uniref:hypothetical protein n=1 Tax=Kitasatospora sp. NPDC127111 TaxID=3345363 RepID=UPI00364183DD
MSGGAHLFHGARALAREGRWAEAHLHTKADPDPVPGLSEARQIAVVAMALEGRAELAGMLLDRTSLEAPWERVVAELLAAACALIGGNASGDQLVAMLDAHDALPTNIPVFDTEVTLAVAELCAAAGKPEIASHLHQHAVGWALEAAEGYSARSLLRHDLAAHLPEPQQRELAAITERAGLGAAPVPAELDDRITAALAMASEVITNAASAGTPDPQQRQ